MGRVMVSMRLPEELIEAIRVRARADGCTATGLIETALRSHLGSPTEAPDPAPAPAKGTGPGSGSGKRPLGEVLAQASEVTARVVDGEIVVCPHAKAMETVKGWGVICDPAKGGCGLKVR